MNRIAVLAGDSSLFGKPSEYAAKILLTEGIFLLRADLSGAKKRTEELFRLYEITEGEKYEKAKRAVINGLRILYPEICSYEVEETLRKNGIEKAVIVVEKEFAKDFAKAMEEKGYKCAVAEIKPERLASATAAKMVFHAKNLLKKLERERREYARER